MTKIYVLLSMVIVSIGTLNAQPDSNDLVKNYKLDFVTPDQPAFNSLGTTPSNLLRPSNTKELSLITSEWFKTKYVIPESFGLEFSPYLLITSQSATLQDYQRHRALASWQLSVGTGKDDNTGKRNIAFGMRLTPIDQGDMRSDKTYLSSLAGIANDIAAERTLTRERFMKEHGITNAQLAENPSRVDSAVSLEMNSSTGHNKEYDAQIEQAREIYKRDNWNANKLDLAIAVLCNSPDSLVRNTYYKKTSLWITGSIKPGATCRNAQVLIGINLFHELKKKEELDTTEFHKINFSLPIRAYVGSNKYKGFVEIQYSFQTFLFPKGWSVQSETLLNFGAEVNAIDGIWIQANAGWHNQFLRKLDTDENSRTSKFTYRIDFRFNLPEKFNLF